MNEFNPAKLELMQLIPPRGQNWENYCFIVIKSLLSRPIVRLLSPTPFLLTCEVRLEEADEGDEEVAPEQDDGVGHRVRVSQVHVGRALGEQRHRGVELLEQEEEEEIVRVLSFITMKNKNKIVFSSETFRDAMQHSKSVHYACLEMLFFSGGH